MIALLIAAAFFAIELLAPAKTDRGELFYGEDE